MSVLVAIDAALNNTGIAVLVDGELVRAWTETNRGEKRGAAAWKSYAQQISRSLAVYVDVVDLLVVETMQVYSKHRDGTKVGDPDDLLEINGLAGALVATIPAVRVTNVRPAEWKGQRPKTAVVDGVTRRLSPTQLARIVSSNPNAIHNAFEAVGIAQHHLEKSA